MKIFEPGAKIYAAEVNDNFAEVLAEANEPRPPIGGAGGVLSGQFPNPGFAVDMATQAELDNAIATRAPIAHTHTPAQIGAIATTERGVAGGVAELGADGFLPVERIPASLLGAVRFQGTWNAATNTPALVSGVGTKGFYYVVSAPGTTALNGESDWAVRDWAIFDGAQWAKIDNSERVEDDTTISALDPSSTNTPRTLRAVLANLWTQIGGKLSKSANLNDLTDAAIARTNLSLGDSATRNVGTVAGTVADGNTAARTNAANTFSQSQTLNGDRVNIGAASSAAVFHFGVRGMLFKSNFGDRSLFEIHSPDGLCRAFHQSVSGVGAGDGYYFSTISNHDVIFSTNGLPVLRLRTTDRNAAFSKKIIVGIEGFAPSGVGHFVNSVASEPVLIAQAAPSQTAPILEMRDSAGTPRPIINAAGELILRDSATNALYRLRVTNGALNVVAT